MKTVKGNLVTLAQQGHFDAIIQGCNCFCTMQSGIAREIKQEFPEAYAADRKTGKGDRNKLGSYSKGIVQLDNLDTLIVVNAYTQYYYGTDRVHVDYDAVGKVFAKIKQDFAGQRIGFPRIGAGLAGGSWVKIEEIIKDNLWGEDFTLVDFVK